MKKSFASIALVLISFFAIAQKTYSTKSGQFSFDASANVDIKGENNQVDSKFNDKTGQIIFNLLIKGFKFSNGLMEDHFNENYMESTKFPKADFKGYITNIATVTFDKDGTYNVTAEGTLTIHGVSQKVKIPGSITVEKGKVTIKTVYKIKVKDFITGSYIGTKISDNAILTVNCQYL
jgi:hypothetical protein